MIGKLTVVALLCLVALAQCQEQKRITPEQAQKMREGIAAGNKLVEIMQSGDFNKFTEPQVDTYVVSWSDAVELVFEFIGSFFPTVEEEILEEVKRGFAQVNARLDVIISELREIKRLIQWKDMQVRFQDIEYRIRLMDESLKNTVRLPKKLVPNAKRNYVQTYRSEYRNAGFALYDSVANNDQVFSMNLLTAAIKYTQAYRSKTQQFSKGLFGMLMKAAAAEVAYAKFSGVDLGQKALWKDRLSNSRKAMKAADTKLVTVSWQQYYKQDAEQYGDRYKNSEDHNDFANRLYNYLSKKFDFRYWMVAAFESTDGTSDQASVFPNHGHRSLKRWRRSFFVVSTEKNARWDLNRARGLCRSYACRELPHICCRDKAVWMMRVSPAYGVGRFVWLRRFKYGFRAQPNRFAMCDADLARPTGGWYQQYKFVYFG